MLDCLCTLQVVFIFIQGRNQAIVVKGPETFFFSILFCSPFVRYRLQLFIQHFQKTILRIWGRPRGPCWLRLWFYYSKRRCFIEELATLQQGCASIEKLDFGGGAVCRGVAANVASERDNTRRGTRARGDYFPSVSLHVMQVCVCVGRVRGDFSSLHSYPECLSK